MKVYETALRQKALSLLRSGARNADVARELNVPAGTIGSWLYADRRQRGIPFKQPADCPWCTDGEFDRLAYAYLLGLYLGDGCISQGRRGVYALRIACADAWPGIMDACGEAMQIIRPSNKVFRVQRQGCQYVTCLSKHWPCFFPQHGPGKKHDREIALTAWQQEIVDTHPWDFIRGLIHSDGCRITNWATRLVRGERRRYEYPRYFFTNLSADILKLYTDTLDKVGVEWKDTNGKNISVARRASVALMDAHVGPKY
ncbi:transcriptional regulator [Streptomyces sp. SID7909]|uniref:transcriptional regulator n=1 Tax=Streptomyces sp. SID7909 TaxID=2706092 RepID=UPI0013B8F07E|nr:transcriptional regulator [Streptomyces sp. SID7909]NEC04933.1 transcriptional regulator [Streptomyces sp. SID7909]